MVLGHSHSRRSRGFTLIELLVVIAIIGVLVALLVPAVQAIRQQANQTQSINNLKQFALGTLNMNTKYSTLGLPPGVGCFPKRLGPPAPTREPSLRGTVFYFLLPFIEGDNIYQTTTETAATGSSTASAGGLPAVLSIFTAAGDMTMPPSGIVTTPSGNMGGISYAANGYVFSGDNGLKAATLNIALDPAPGVPIFNGVALLPGLPSNLPVAIIPKTMKDGASNTILFMEKAAVCQGVASPRKGYETPGAGGGHGWPNDAYFSYASPGSGLNSNNVPVQSSLFLPQFSAPPNPAVIYPDCKLPQAHVSGTIAVSMADGSTHVVNFAVSQQTWALLLLPNDGAPLPNDWQ